MGKKEKYYKFFKTNSEYLGNIDIANAGQQLLLIMTSIKTMIDKPSFASLNDKVDDFDPMAFQNQLPDKPKNKGLTFLGNSKPNAQTTDLLGGDADDIFGSSGNSNGNPNGQPKPAEDLGKKKGNAFGFIKKKPTDEP
jgi:hypothetical protein